MKLFLLAILAVFSSVSYSQSITYPANGKSSFGGAVGLGSLTITESADTVKLTLTRGPGLFDSLLVFYVDEPETNTGIASTANITYMGVPDKYSVAASGYFSPTQASVLNFPPMFRPDMAVVFDKDGGKIFFLADTLGMTLMQEQGTFPVYPTGGNSSPTYSAITFKSQYGVLPTDSLSFKFMASYIGQTASRSNEGFGDPFIGVMRTNGYTPYTVQSWFSFSSQEALPVNLVDIKANADRGTVHIKWTVAQEINIEAYEVQRSANGRDFTTITTVKATQASGTKSYSATDISPLPGNNYYRLLITERAGKQVSKVIVVKNGFSKNNLSVVQTGDRLNIQLENVPAGDYRLNVVNSNGQLVQTNSIAHDGVNGTRQVSLNNHPAKGIYRIVLQSGTTLLTQSILIN